jgi:hypothetical protein
LEIDALSPIANYATADYAAIMDRGNLKDADVLNELARKSLVPARHYANTKIFGECINQVRRMEAAIVFGQIHVHGSGVDEAEVDNLVTRYRFFSLPRFTGLPAKKGGTSCLPRSGCYDQAPGRAREHGGQRAPSTWRRSRKASVRFACHEAWRECT